MRIYLGFILFIAATLLPLQGSASDAKALQAERREAQQQRQQSKKQRSQENRQAIQAFREYSKTLKQDYSERLRELDTEYRIQSIELDAERQKKMAAADAELQKYIMQMFLNPKANEKQSFDQLKIDMKAYSDKVYKIKRQASDEKHEKYILNEQRKHQLLSERDDKALAEARELGLLDKPAIILAKPIGNQLTANEIRWNENEEKTVERMASANQRALGEFNYGKKLREWEIANKREDYLLQVEKEEKLHALNSEQTMLSSLLATQQGQDNSQEFANQLSEISRKQQEISIEMNKLQQINKTRRREERRKITGR